MKKESLDILFENLLSKAPLTKEDHWDEFEIRLHKKMFYKFSWNRFNVYYLTLIIFSVLTNIFVLAAFINLPQVQRTRQQIILHSDTSKFLASDIINTEKNKSYKNTSLKTDHLSDTNKDSIVTLLPQIKSDTLNNVVTENTTINSIIPASIPVVIKRKSTIYISKRDTIINVDTIKIKKKR